jgi:hypothetical protein
MNESSRDRVLVPFLNVSCLHRAASGDEGDKAFLVSSRSTSNESTATEPAVFLAKIYVMISTVMNPRMTAVLAAEFEGASYTIQALKRDLDLEVRSLNSQFSIFLVPSSSFAQLQSNEIEIIDGIHHDV